VRVELPVRVAEHLDARVAEVAPGFAGRLLCAVEGDTVRLFDESGQARGEVPDAEAGESVLPLEFEVTAEGIAKADDWVRDEAGRFAAQPGGGAGEEPADGGEAMAAAADRFADDGGQVSGPADGYARIAARDTLDEMGLDDTMGQRYTRLALDEPRVQIAEVEGFGVAGAAGYTPPIAPTEQERDAGVEEGRVHLEYLGSTDVADGAGSALMREVVAEAAAAGVSLTTEPDSADAEAFFAQMGLETDPYGIGSEHLMGLSSDGVAALAAASGADVDRYRTGVEPPGERVELGSVGRHEEVDAPQDLGATAEETRSWAETHIENSRAGDGYAAAAQHYIEGRPLNSHIREGRIDRPERAQFVRELDAAVEGSVVAEPLRVTRGVDSDALPEFAEVAEALRGDGDASAVLGMQITDPAFQSTTVFDAPPSIAGDLEMDIVLPEGARARALIDTEYWESEAEVLLPRDTTMAVVGLDRDNDRVQMAVVDQRLHTDVAEKADGYVRDEAGRFASQPGSGGSEEEEVDGQGLNGQVEMGDAPAHDSVEPGLPWGYSHAEMQARADKVVTNGPISEGYEEAVQHYTGGRGLSVNDVVRTGRTDRPDLTEQVRALDEAVEGSVINEPVRLSRGVQPDVTPELEELTRAVTDPDYDVSRVQGMRITDAGFQSTSLAEDPPPKFYIGAVVMDIVAPAGARGRVLSESEYFTLEGEVLLPRDTTLEVTGIDRENPQGLGARVQMAVVDQRLHTEQQ